MFRCTIALLCALLVRCAVGSNLESLALEKVLAYASPIFGDYENVQSNTSTWMSTKDDSLPIVHMNIPGVHDADTWNYSVATQDSLLGITDLANITLYPPEFYRCQNVSLIRMLDAGIRVFDLRPALDPTNSTLVFWHGGGLLSETATMADVMFGFYKWLDDHPSEAVFLSFEYETDTTPYGVEDAQVDKHLYDILSSPEAKQYILQTTGSFGTLGEARGKVTLLKRFDLSYLPTSYAASLPGVHFSPTLWTDNSPNITLVYNATTGATAYIEDYYAIGAPTGSDDAVNIQWKFNATAAHLTYAATAHPDALFWTFASSEHTSNVPFQTPEIQALGDGVGVPGVNQKLVPFLEGMRGKRVGIVMFDFFEVPSGLVPLLLSL